MPHLHKHFFAFVGVLHQQRTAVQKACYSLETFFAGEEHQQGRKLFSNMRRLTFLLNFALCTICNAYAQNNLSSEQLHRIADAGKLWGYVKYFHPYAQTRHINLDSAFAATVPAIIAAKDKAEYQQALQHFLSVLHDPLTTILKDTTFTSKVSINCFIKDSALYIDATNAAMLNRSSLFQYADTLKKAYETLNSVNRIVFDIRKKGVKTNDNLDRLFRMADPSPYLLAKSIYGPANRTIAHQGFVAEGGGWGGKDYFQQTTATRFKGKAAKEKPVVVIVNEVSDLPPLMQAMQSAGKAAIIQQKGAGDITGSFLEYYAADSVLVRIRNGEAINTDGAKGFVPDDEYNIEDNDAVIYAEANTVQINQNKQRPSTGDTFTSFPTEYFEAEGRYPSLGYRVLAAAKIYTIIDHFYYNKRLMDSNWNSMYERYLPQFIAAKDSMDYIKAVAAFYAHIQDGHGNIGGSRTYDVLMHSGRNTSPVAAHIIENKLVVTAIINDSAARSAGIAIGDVIEKVDGKDAMETINSLRKYQPAGNYAAQGNYIAMYFLKREKHDSIILQIKDKTAKVKTVILHVSDKEDGDRALWYDAVAGRSRHTPLRFITKDIGYVDLRILKMEEVDSVFTRFRKTKALVLDMRGYPETGAGFEIAKRLTNKPEVTATIGKYVVATSPNVEATNSEELDRDEVVTYNQKWSSKAPFYSGKTVFLMYETTQSMAEHVGMCLKSMGNTTFIGTPTAGANGTQTIFSIPGEVDLAFSAMNFALGNGTPMQRIGLQPDVYAAPTIKGIQQGKDEVLDKAIKYLHNLLY